MPEQLDVVGIGNAVVDVISDCDDAFLQEMAMHKGSMQLIDEGRAKVIYEKVGPTSTHSGGSVGNSMAGLAQLGGKAAFIGRVRDDTLGRSFRHDMQAIGVEFSTLAAKRGKPTARSYILITPDGERTMNTYIGACAELEPEDIDGETIKRAKILLVEGYLWDAESAKRAIRQALAIARDNGTRVAFSLSDTFCVERHREDFRKLVRDHCDILFANQAEVMALYELGSVEAASEKLSGEVPFACVTRSEEGSTILQDGKAVDIAAVPVERLVDATGAGDAYAAGVLYGLAKDWDATRCGTLGSLCASDVISQVGARARQPLRRHLERLQNAA